MPFVAVFKENMMFKRSTRTLQLELPYSNKIMADILANAVKQLKWKVKQIDAATGQIQARTNITALS